MATQKPLTAYLVDAVTRERLAFQYNPNDIVDSKSTSYATLVVPGMSHPRYQFVAGDARKISFTVSFYQKDVQKQVAWL
jgi:phage protein U